MRLVGVDPLEDVVEQDRSGLLGQLLRVLHQDDQLLVLAADGLVQFLEVDVSSHH